MDKDYDLVFDTPRGNRSGYLIFMIEKQALNGVLNIGSANASFFGGTFDERQFSFKGSIYFHYLHLNYQVKGQWLSDMIQGSLYIRHMKFNFMGVPHIRKHQPED